MSDSGLETRFDEVGNLYGRLPGSRFPDDVILSGSHIDSVVNGGNLDGQFGAGGLAGGPLAKETYGAPLRTVEVLALAEEEGSRFPYVFWGSKISSASLTRRTCVRLKTPKAWRLSML